MITNQLLLLTKLLVLLVKLLKYIIHVFKTWVYTIIFILILGYKYTYMSIYNYAK